ncbi:hypothetical protein D3C81_2079640 [compost metagenome]
MPLRAHLADVLGAMTERVSDNQILASVISMVVVLVVDLRVLGAEAAEDALIVTLLQAGFSLCAVPGVSGFHVVVVLAPEMALDGEHNGCKAAHREVGA